MSDNILSAVLTFSLMAAGTIAVGAEMVGGRSHERVIATMPAVSVVGHRLAAAEPIMLPMVTVTGCRTAATEVAVESSDVESRLQ